MNSQLDIVCFYVDLGRPYLPLIEAMTKSAKAMMPECRTVIMTPTPSAKLLKLFDLAIVIKMEANWQTLCLDKARAIMTWQDQMERPCVFIDPDIEFRKPVVFPDCDVGLIWCRSKLANPVNAGMILAKPGCKEFWKKYGSIAASLPRPLHSWWCDQLAFSLMVGTLRNPGDVIQAYDAKVQLISEEIACAPQERANQETWAIHYKGSRKGKEWEKYFRPQNELIASSQDGKLLPVSV